MQNLLPFSSPGIVGDLKGNFHALVWAPEAQKVEVVPEKGVSVLLQKGDLGFWHAQSLALKSGDAYHIRLNGNQLLPDPASRSQPHGVHGSSRVLDVSCFAWSDDNWKCIPMHEMVMYELHVGTFSKRGDFQGVAEKLDYLVSLGINAIELMPVSQFPGNRNWGYDGVFPFAVQNSYGGAIGLQQLVDACHARGIAVILDVVYNHLGPEGNYLHPFGPFFTDKYQTPWGSAINFDDSWCDGVRHFFLQNALMWLRDFHIDGLRLDAVHAIRDFSAHHFLARLKQETMALTKSTGRDYLLIGECDLNDTRYINPFEKGGYSLDGQWCDEFHHALHALVTGERNGYYADFGALSHLVKSLNDAYVYDGEYSPHRKKIFGTTSAGQPKDKFVVFAQNHDQTGNRMMGDRMSSLVGFNTLKLIAGVVLLSPYVPMLFMGEEYGETAPFLYFTSHSDKKLIHGVREGRKREFREFMKKGAEPPDPQSELTFYHSVIDVDGELSDNQLVLLRFYKVLIHLRKTHSIIRRCKPASIRASTVNEHVLLLERKNEGYSLNCYFNFGSEAFVKKTTSSSSEEVLLFSDASEWHGGSEQPFRTLNGHEELVLPSGSFVVLRHWNRHIQDPTLHY